MQKVYKVTVNPDCDTITFWHEFRKVFDAPILPPVWYATEECIEEYKKLKGWHNPDAPIGEQEPLVFELADFYVDID